MTVEVWMRPLDSGLRHALDAVHAALELEPAPGAAALDEQHDLLEAAHAGRVAVHHLDLPLLPLRVLRVHAREVGGEEPRLVPAGAGADLDEDVLVVVGILRQDQRAELVLELALARGELVHLGLRHLAHLAVGVLGGHVAGLLEASQELLVLLELQDDLGELGRGLGGLGVGGRLADDGGIGHRAGQLAVPLLDLAKLVKHGAPSRGIGQTGTPRTETGTEELFACRLRGAALGRPVPYPSASGFLLYLRWKRSTRPAVSRNFCLPVKNGWHFEQTSTRIWGWVERV